VRLSLAPEGALVVADAELFGCVHFVGQKQPMLSGAGSVR
jgi:hypothetical protein